MRQNLGLGIPPLDQRTTKNAVFVRLSYQLFLLFTGVYVIGACAVSNHGNDRDRDLGGDSAVAVLDDKPTSNGRDGSAGRDDDSAAMNDDNRTFDDRDGMTLEAGYIEVDAGLVDDQSDEPDTDCSWEAVFPTFGTQHLFAIWGSASDDVYAVGESGTMLHYDGQKWAKKAIDTASDLMDIWGSGTDDVYLVGSNYQLSARPKGNIVLHYDGRSWTEVDLDYVRNTCYLTTVFGTGPDNVFVAGECDQIWRFDGSRWTSAAPQLDEQAIWSDVFSCGIEEIFAIDDSEEALYRFDREMSRFQPVRELSWLAESFAGSGLCVAPDDIWIISDEFFIPMGSESNGVIHWDGRSWLALENQAPETAGQIFTNMFVTSDNQRYLVGKKGALFHFDGSIWASMATGTQATYRDVWGASGEQLFAVGDLGVLTEINSDGLRDLNGGVDASVIKLLDLGSDGVAAITRRGQVVIGNQRQWRVSSDPVLTTIYAFSARGTQADDILIGGSQDRSPVLIHFNGADFELIDLDVVIEHDGTVCTEVQDFHSIAGDLYILCDSGDVIRQDGDRFRSLAPESSCGLPAVSRFPISGPRRNVSNMRISGDTPDNIFISGSVFGAPEGGRFGGEDVFACHYNGSIWTEIPVDERLQNQLLSPFLPWPRINAVWGRSDDIYVLYTIEADAPRSELSWSHCDLWIEHYDGLEWTLVAGCGADPDSSIQTGKGEWDFSGAADNGFIRVNGGYVYFNGTSWQFVPFLVGENRPWFASTSETGIYAATERGTIYYRVCPSAG